VVLIDGMPIVSALSTVYGLQGIPNSLIDRIELNLQITKKFKHNIEVYSGIKNLLNFTPENPLMRPFDPFDKRKMIR